MRKFTAKALDEFEKEGRYYALLEISSKDKCEHCIFACDNDSVLEGLGSDAERAAEMFALIISGEASVIHIGEIVHDLKCENLI